ncbi:MAG: serine/threonine-protein kinase, partial [Thermoanaerobaculia bacterium]
MAQVLALCADRLNAGEVLDLDQLLAAHPDLSPELGEALGAFHQIGPSCKQSSPLETLGDYRILREVGHGGMGVVYEAQHTTTNRRVALKVLSGGLLANPRAVARFRREARVLSRLDHRGVCTVYEAGMADGTPFIAMRFLEGENLAMKLRRASGNGAASTAASTTTGPAEVSSSREVPPERRGGREASRTPTHDEILGFVEVIEKVARALHVAHQAGLVHRDIKPGNLMVTPEGEPVILDFGLARDVKGESALTQSGELMGTPTYMSPEQIGGRPVDRRTDVYSLGVTLYQCLTLQVPFEAPTREVLYQRILGSDPPAPRRLNPKISKDLKVVLETALEKNVDRRYQTALDFAEDLRRVRAFEPIRA